MEVNAAALRTILETKGIKFRDFAKASEMTASRASQILNGRQRPGQRTMTRILAGLKLLEFTREELGAIGLSALFAGDVDAQ